MKTRIVRLLGAASLFLASQSAQVYAAAPIVPIDTQPELQVVPPMPIKQTQALQVQSPLLQPMQPMAEQPPVGTVIYEEEVRGNALQRFFTDNEWYASWGFSTEGYSPSDLKVRQPGLGNDFTLNQIRGKDAPSWQSIFGSQYNIRIGKFIDPERTLAVELNLDHTRYWTTPGQTVRMTGTFAGRPVNQNVIINNPFFEYKLFNGGNPLMLNLVKRVPLIGQPEERWSLAGIGKFGVGIMLPHAEVIINGQNNEAEVGEKKFGNYLGFSRGWWQIDGFTTGFEGGFRLGLSKNFYLEITDKINFATLSGIPVYQGTARQNLWMNEVIFSLGYTWGRR